MVSYAFMYFNLMVARRTVITLKYQNVLLILLTFKKQTMKIYQILIMGDLI